MTHNSKGAIILNVYKDKLAQALTIGSTLMLAIKEKTSSTEFQHIYPHPDEKLTSLVDRNSQVNQATVPRAISVSYASALIWQMEQDSDSMCSSEEETSKESKSRNWSELNTADLPRAGGVSTNYSQKNDNSSFKTQVSLKHWPNPDGKLSDSTISPDYQSTVSKLVDRLEALESSYQDIQKQLSTHKMMLEENHQRSLQTDELIRQFIGTFSTPLSKLLNIEESPN